ncbi:MAG: hypothetical protein Q9170_002469 [Blastenia crenularia]
MEEIVKPPNPLQKSEWYATASLYSSYWAIFEIYLSFIHVSWFHYHREPTNRIASLESLQSWIARASSIDPSDQILMTARGKQVKIQSLSLETEIFVYNRQILSASGQASLSASLPTAAAPEQYRPKAPPDGPRSKDVPEAWHELFDGRRRWAIELQDRCSTVGEQIKRLDSEATIIRRSAAIAVENIKQHIASLRPRFEDSRIWADNVLQDQSLLLQEWGRTVGKYSSVPAIKTLGACLSGGPITSQHDSKGSSSESETSLYDFVDIGQLTKANNNAKSSHQRFKNRADEVNVAFFDVEQKADSIVDNFNRDANLSDSIAIEQCDHLLEEIQAMTTKIKADHDHVLGLSQASNAITQMTRIALLHTRSFIPTLLQTATELNQLLQKAVVRKDDAQMSGVQYLQNISTVESRIALVHTKLASLDVDSDDGQAFEVLGSVTKMASVYGLLLVESVKRLEWTEKITTDSSTLVEEVATFKEEEVKRRKKWIRDMEGAVDLGAIDDMSVNIDVEVQAEKQHWPKVSREDIHAYKKTLENLEGFEGAVTEIEKAYATLDAPTKQQSRRVKAFKHGSIHDTAFGRNSLLLRGDDEILHTLKGEKSKLEDKLKSSQSRIRKLEDLLHRQSQVSRPSSSENPFNIQVPRGTSPTIGFAPTLAREPASRRSSTSSRRISLHNESDEKSLGKRIVSLEAELSAQKAQSASLQKDAAARVNVEDNLKAQVREAISVKEDLLSNFEAQQKEFEDERRLLEDDNVKLKIRLEEAEDELDRVIGSRDREARAEEEIHRIREAAEHDVRAARDQLESYRHEYRTLQGANERLQQEHSELQTQTASRRQDWDNAEAKHCTTIHSALSYLEHELAVPGDLNGSVRAVEAAARKYRANLDEVSRLLAEVHQVNEDLVSNAKDREAQLEELRDRLGNEEMEVFSTREVLAEQREEAARFRDEFEKERMEHDRLKTKHQASRECVHSSSREIGVLQAALEEVRDKSRDFESKLQGVHGISSERAARAETISQRLFTQANQLEKLLQQIGYAVNRQQGSPMAIQKMPKAPGTSTVLSPSGPLPASDPSPFPDYLSWATSEDPDRESRLYDLFGQELASFDMDAFHEAIIKRIKDAEHLARKWQREARGYRDKFHRAQSEGHEKIAFRSFKEGDLALFLPTRNQATRPWAAFNVGAPHYFLREQDSHKLRSRDWLLARISKVEERIVDLSKSINGMNATGDRRSIGDVSDGASLDDENPFELSDGLRWYLLDAAEEKPGAPINVGLGKATVASASVDAKGSSIRPGRKSDGKDGATKTLTRSLDSRRSSTNSRKNQPVVGIPSPAPPGSAGGVGMTGESGAKDVSDQAGNEGSQNTDEVCKNLLWGRGYHAISGTTTVQSDEGRHVSNEVDSGHASHAERFFVATVIVERAEAVSQQGSVARESQIQSLELVVVIGLQFGGWEGEEMKWSTVRISLLQPRALDFAWWFQPRFNPLDDVSAATSSRVVQPLEGVNKNLNIGQYQPPTTNLNNGSFSLSSRPAFGRKGTGDVLKGLPALPLSLDIPRSSYRRPVSDVETNPSLYSQPSPEMQSSYIPERLHIPQKTNGQTHDVSPPESIKGHNGNQHNTHGSSPDVSPVTETSSPIFERPPVNGRHTSGIPVLKKTQRFGSAGNKWSNWRGRGTEVTTPEPESTSPSGTRWDEYSGERTNSEKGKPGQVIPGSIPFDPKPGQVARPLAFGNTTTISGGGPAQVRRKRVPSRDENFTPAVREEWKGASGRHKIINPLMDKPLPPGISAVFKTGSRRLSESPTETTRTRDAISPTSGLALSAISDEATPTRATFHQPAIRIDEDPNDSPGSVAIGSPVSIVTPLSREPESTSTPNSLADIDTLFDRQPDSTTDSKLSPEDKRSPLERHPSAEGMKLKPQPPTPDATPDSSREPQGHHNLERDFRENFHHMNLEDQPPSRFSVTTYATTAYNSPPATPETTHDSPTQTPPPSILNRKRPVPVAGIPTKRKPTPSEAEQARENRHTKTLPKSPPEVEAQTRVASLQASLDNLRRRKNNIQTVLYELTNVVQPSSITYDIAAKKEIKRTVEGLNKELAEVMKEEHETGLQLHRAWKREDSNSAYEPTTLWVRRVTT